MIFSASSLLCSVEVSLLGPALSGSETDLDAAFWPSRSNVLTSTFDSPY